MARAAAEGFSRSVYSSLYLTLHYICQITPTECRNLSSALETFTYNRNIAQMTKIKMYSPGCLAVLFKTIAVWFCFHIAMETLLKGFNTIYCVKLKKKSVSPVLENKASQFLPISLQGVMDANCGRVTSHGRLLSFLGKHSGDKWTWSFRWIGKQSGDKKKRNDNLFWCA